ESSESEDRDVALALLRRRLSEAAEGQAPDLERERLTVDAILDGLVAYYERQGRASIGAAVSQMKGWREALGSMRATALETRHVARVISDWQRHVKAATINRRLSLLRRAYRLAKLRLDPARLDFSDLFLPELSPRGRYLTAGAFQA